jgi:hypothetical protein
MNAIDIKATTSTPEIRYDEEGKLLIRGRSITEGGMDFYRPLLHWAETLKRKMLIVDLHLEYLNSMSLKKLIQFLKILDTNIHIHILFINWHYEEGDDDSLEKGRLMEGLLRKADFRLHTYKD